MWNYKKSVVLSISVCFVVLALVAVAAILMPWLIEQYYGVYQGEDRDRINYLIKYILICFYPSAVFGSAAVAMLIKMLFNINSGKVFVNSNVACLRVISWCCFAVAAITFYGGIKYIPFFFISAASVLVGIILRVVKNVMQTAVEMREENDLVI